MNKIRRERVDAFFLWYNGNNHSKKENYYQEELTHDKLSTLSRADFVEFFFQFARDGGQIQSGGYRTAGRFRETMEAHYDDFHTFALEPFSDDFDEIAWLSRIGSFNGFGKGLATIFLNRIDKNRFAILNNKAVEAIKLMGVSIPSELTAQYEAIRIAELQLIEWYPEFENLYQVDALTHFLIGTDVGKPWADALRGSSQAGPQYWLMAPGREAEHWSTCIEKGVILYGADEFPDLTPYDTKEKVSDLFASVFEDGGKKTNNILATYEFAHVMKEGDIVIVKKGIYKLLGYGRVTSGYRWDASREVYRNTRDVEWVKTGEWSTPEGEQLAMKTLTDLTPYDGYAGKLIGIIEGHVSNEEEQEGKSFNSIQYDWPFYPGLVLGSGANEYRITRITPENIELRKTSNNVDRFIPTVVIRALCVALDRGKIDLTDLQRRQNSGAGHVFDKIGFKHDKFIMGYDATIYKLCEYYVENDSSAKQQIIPFSTEEFLVALGDAALTLGLSIPCAIASSLHAKPFLILTGLSGSGKTQLAQAFSKWICASEEQRAVVAVGADWTSNENLLGYPDALSPKSYRKPDNGALDLILRAKDDPENPYFLILDEMNLSHVERYFADFLSAMESGEAISLHDDTGEDWDAGDGGSKVPAKLTVPKNLFVIGTVNVDETTYMFSPKVLDRANVIEFRVSDDEMKSFLENPVKPDLDAIAGQGSQYAKAFVTSAKQKDVPLDDTTRKQVSNVLMQFFPELKEAGAEFGYRTAHEICRFIHFHKELSAEGWEFNSAMDAAIMQKLLPKLHGSKKKLGPVLAALIRLCLKEEARPESDPIKDVILTKENTLYPNSVEKLARMRKRLAEHGFTSFAEA